MSTTRLLMLYTHEDRSDPFVVAYKVISFENDVKTRAIAERMAERHGVKYGHVAIVEAGQCVEKIEIGAY